MSRGDNKETESHCLVEGEQKPIARRVRTETTTRVSITLFSKKLQIF